MKTLTLFIIAIILYLFPGLSWASFAPGFLDVATSRTIASAGNQYSDSFDEANILWRPITATGLALAPGLPVTNFKVSGNLLILPSGYAEAGAYHSASISDISQIILKSQSVFFFLKYKTVRAGSNNTGYSVRFDYAIGNNWEDCIFYKMELPSMPM